MCLEDNLLKDVWLSLYKNELSAKVEGVDTRIVGPFMLVERTVLAFKELGLNYVSTLQEVSVIKTDLDSATNELKILKEKLNETQKPCENCGILAKELSFAKKRANEAEFRVTQIANILVVPSSDNVEDTGDTKSPKRKRACLRDKDDNANEDTSSSSQTVEIGCSGSLPSPDKNKDYDGKRQKALPTNSSSPEMSRSPKKSRSPKTSISPKNKNVNNKLKRLSRSTEFEDGVSKKTSPRRNLSADFDVEIISPSKRYRRSHCQSNKVPNDKDDKLKTVVKEKNDSFTEYSKRCGSELDQLWFGGDAFVAAKNKNKENNQIDIIESTSKTKTKEQDLRSTDNGKNKKSNRTLRSDKMVKNSDNSYDLILEMKVPKKKLKQLTLQMRPTNTQNNEVESDPDDIVLPSPNKFQLEGGEVQEAEEDLDITFAPGVTSTQKPPESESDILDRRKTPSPVKRRVTTAASSKRQLDNSFDVILDKRRTTPSPNYKYKGKTVRGKARAQLQGWDCEECQKFYELACKNLSPSKIKAKMNMCSRHRSKHKQARPPTPPGFWDLDIPDTPE